MISKYTNPAIHTADEWNAMAADAVRRSHESWERSDTDGALSQWASDSICHFYRDLAAVAANGNRRHIPWLFNATTGQPLDHGSWRWVQSRFGDSIAIGDRPDTVWFRPSQASDPAVREARDREKGFVWGVVDAEVVLYQFGDVVLMTGYEARRGAELTVITVGDYSR